MDEGLRRLSEQSMDDFLRRSERFPVGAHGRMRLLDYSARNDRKLRQQELLTASN